MYCAKRGALESEKIEYFEAMFEYYNINYFDMEGVR
jgi:hypothetical protein